MASNGIVGQWLSAVYTCLRYPKLQSFTISQISMLKPQLKSSPRPIPPSHWSMCWRPVPLALASHSDAPVPSSHPSVAMVMTLLGSGNRPQSQWSSKHRLLHQLSMFQSHPHESTETLRSFVRKRERILWHGAMGKAKHHVKPIPNSP